MRQDEQLQNRILYILKYLAIKNIVNNPKKLLPPLSNSLTIDKVL